MMEAVFPVAALASLKVAEPSPMTTVSPESIPPVPALSATVARELASYVLLVADAVIVRILGVMSAVVVAVMLSIA